MEQFSLPWVSDRSILAAEVRRFRGWEQQDWVDDQDQRPALARWDARVLMEWDLADLIWAPTPHVLETTRAAGAAQSKLQVIPYPVPDVPASISSLRETRDSRQPLRVIFAGTLCLFKGVQYIYEALRSWPPAGGLDMHFYGRSALLPEGEARLAEVGTIHGHLSRARLLEEFARADVLLFPSLSEGSALVTLEATATGLPVISTVEGGAPESAMRIDAGSPEAIRNALEYLLDNRGALTDLSSASLRVARSRTQAAFFQAFASAVTEAAVGPT